MAGDAWAEIERLRAEVARLERALAAAELLADRDPLFPLLNRRAFVRELGRALAFQARYGGEAALVFLDLDGLKRINDGHGHAAGDAALALVASVLTDELRESDVVGRLGGDEFAAVLSHATVEEAKGKAERLAAVVAAAPLVHGGATLELSVSWGVRALKPGRAPAELLADADAAMYLHKAGRGALRR